MSDPAASPRVLYFYFDYLSPYSYLAWTKLQGLAKRKGATIEPVPVLLAALLAAHGQKGPAEIPAKRLYTFKHIIRLAHDLGIPASMPPSHPFNPLLALRVSCLPFDPIVKRALVDVMFREVWAGGRGVEDPTVVRELLAAYGLDPDAEIARATSDENKARLRANTDDAIRRGVFGVPSIRIDDEVFWGFDSLPHLERFIDGNDPVTPEFLAQLDALVATAQRGT